jgi:hypothetical protein
MVKRMGIAKHGMRPFLSIRLMVWMERMAVSSAKTVPRTKQTEPSKTVPRTKQTEPTKTL